MNKNKAILWGSILGGNAMRVEAIHEAGIFQIKSKCNSNLL